MVEGLPKIRPIVTPTRLAVITPEPRMSHAFLPLGCAGVGERGWEQRQICLFAAVPMREDPAVLERTGDPGRLDASSLTHADPRCIKNGRF
jgi:hypothetical protein